MEFNELFEKFLNDDSFQEEVENITDDNSYNEFARKYDVPYTLEELVDLLNKKSETSNCDTRSFSKKTYNELGFPHTYDIKISADDHPLIITVYHKCKLLDGPFCGKCSSSVNRGGIWYCLRRCKEYDPCYKK